MWNVLIVCIYPTSFHYTLMLVCSGLAERRERRRAKKAIVAPKPKSPESDSEEESDTQRRRRTGKSSKKTKKSKGLNMPAGLALMHGFAATNIGKNRLTVSLHGSVASSGLTVEDRFSSIPLWAYSTKARRLRRPRSRRVRPLVSRFGCGLDPL